MRVKPQNTKVTVIVRYAMDYDGEVGESDIDIQDIIHDPDAIKNVTVRTKAIKATFHPKTGWGVRN